MSCPGTNHTEMMQTSLGQRSERLYKDTIKKYFGIVFPVFLTHLAIKLISGSLAVFVIDHGKFWNDFNHVYCWVVDIANRWDAGWYLGIARTGYTSESSVFFPLYPALMRLFSWGDSYSSYATTGFVLSLVFFLLALIVIYKLTAKLYSEQIARRTIWLVALFPASFFLTSIYPTSLYLLAIALYFFGLKEMRLWMIIVGGLVAALSWNSGVILAASGAVWILVKYWKLKSRPVNKLYVSASILAPLSGLAVYGVYLWTTLGTPFAAIIAESEQFKLNFGAPLFVQVKTIIDWAATVFRGNLSMPFLLDNVNLVNIFNIFAVVLAILGFIFMVKDKKTIIFMPFVAICLLVYISINHEYELVESTARMVMVLFPLWAALVNRIKARRTLWELYVFSAIFMVIGNLLFAGGYWMT